MSNRNNGINFPVNTHIAYLASSQRLLSYVNKKVFQTLVSGTLSCNENKTGVEAIERSAEAEIDRNRYLAVFVTPDRVTSQQNFNDAILKSADLQSVDSTKPGCFLMDRRGQTWLLPSTRRR